MKCIHGVLINQECPSCDGSEPLSFLNFKPPMNTVVKFPDDIGGSVIPAEHPDVVLPVLHEAASFTAEQWERIPSLIRKDGPAITAHSLLKSGAEVLEARAREYDKPGGERSILAVVTALNAVLGREALSEAEGWLFMQLLKDVRLFSAPGYHADSGVDVVNYSALMSEAKARRAE